MSPSANGLNIVPAHQVVDNHACEALNREPSSEAIDA